MDLRTSISEMKALIASKSQEIKIFKKLWYTGQGTDGDQRTRKMYALEQPGKCFSIILTLNLGGKGKNYPHSFEGIKNNWRQDPITKTYQI